MADNTTLNTMTGGDVIASDEIGGTYKVQRIKVGFGADGSYADVESTATNPLPVVTAEPTPGNTALTKAENAASAGGDVGIAAMVVRDDALTTLTPVDGDYTNLRVTSTGALWTQVTGTVTVDGSGVTQPISAASLPLPTGASTSALQTTGNTSLSTIAGAVTGTEMQVDVVASLPSGANTIGDVGLITRTSGGPTIFRSIDLDETEEQIKATAGQIYWIHAMNLSTGIRYLKVYNATAATVVVGTTTPVLTFPIPSTSGPSGAGFVFNIPQGIPFGTAITVAATTGVADADTGAPGANEVIVNIGYA